MTLSAAAIAQETCSSRGDSSLEMRVIGYEGCGIIFEQAERNDVIKKALKDVDDDLHNDNISHVAIRASFDALADKFPELPCLGQVYDFVSARDRTWWDHSIHRFPKQNATKENLLFSE